MIVRTVLLSACAIGFAFPALAQTARADAPATLGGPVVPGVCLLSREAVFANAAVGRAATARLAELTAEAQAGIAAVRGPLEAEAGVLRTLPDSEENRARAQAFSGRWEALQRQAGQATQEIEATRLAALSRIADTVQPVIAEVYAARNCGLLFDRASALGGNFANDLTASVVQGLDARVTTITFERERLPPSDAAR